MDDHKAWLEAREGLMRKKEVEQHSGSKAKVALEAARIRKKR